MKNFYSWLLLVCLAFFGSVAHAMDVPLGAGDVLKISVFGNPDLSLESKVSEAGSISYPLVGDVAIAGLTTADAEKKIAGLLEQGGFVLKPQVNIIVTLLQSQQVSVLGQVNRPGRYPLDGKRSLVDVIAMAGGVNPDGGDMIVLTRSRGGKISRDTIDLMEAVRTGDADHNPQLATGDTVYVERAPRFYIYGEVQRPGVFRLERYMTLAQALSVGGGLSSKGTERGIQIKRRDAEGTLKAIDARHDDLIQENDVIYVKESLF